MQKRSKRGLLMAEFNVQVFSDGNVDWGDLSRFIRPPDIDAPRLLSGLMAEARRHRREEAGLAA